MRRTSAGSIARPSFLSSHASGRSMGGGAGMSRFTSTRPPTSVAVGQSSFSRAIARASARVVVSALGHFAVTAPAEASLAFHPSAWLDAARAGHPRIISQNVTHGGPFRSSPVGRCELRPIISPDFQAHSCLVLVRTSTLPQMTYTRQRVRILGGLQY
jgi:hypothetical protein